MSQLAPAEDFYFFAEVVYEASLYQCLWIDGLAFFEVFYSVEVNDGIGGFEPGVIKASFGQSSEQRHLTSLTGDGSCFAGPGILTFVAPTGGFSETRTGAPAAAGSEFVFWNETGDFMVHHWDSCSCNWSLTPRSFSICSFE